MVGKAFEFEAGGLEFHAVRLKGEDTPGIRCPGGCLDFRDGSKSRERFRLEFPHLVGPSAAFVEDRTAAASFSGCLL